MTRSTWGWRYFLGLPEARIRLDWIQAVAIFTALALLVFGLVVTTEIPKAWWGAAYEPASLLQRPVIQWPLLILALLCAWLGGWLMPRLIRRPWLTTGLALACLLLPWYFGFSQFGGYGLWVWRTLVLGGDGDAMGYGYWVEPGYLGALLLLPVLVVVAERVRVTRFGLFDLYVLLHAVLLGLGTTLLISQNHAPLALVLLGAGLMTALLARPWGAALVLHVILLTLVVGWTLILQEVWFTKVMKGELGHKPPAEIHEQGLLSQTWNNAGWWGMPPAPFTTEQPVHSLTTENIAAALQASPQVRLPRDPEYRLNATTQLYGWIVAGLVLAVLLLHVWALVRLGSRLRGEAYRVERWTAWVYASVPALMAVMSTLTATGWLSLPWPAMVFPWLGSADELNSLYGLAWLSGSIIALAARIPPDGAAQG